MPSAYFPLIPDPVSPPASVGVGAPTIAPYTDRTGLGSGLLTPFRRDAKGDFVSGAGVDMVRSGVVQVLGTRADDGRMTGELPWRPEFGSVLHRLQYMPIDATFAALLRTRVIEAVSLWEPRARVSGVVIRRAYDSNGQVRAVARVAYDIVQAGTNNILAANQALEVPIQS